jgi:hypothetical protein
VVVLDWVTGRVMNNIMGVTDKRLNRDEIWYLVSEWSKEKLLLCFPFLQFTAVSSFMPYSGPTNRRSPAFHFRNDPDSDSDDDDDDIPFPRSTPILLSNGKPLKSSLKSSSSTSHIPSPPPTLHTRARSAPSSPLFSSPKNVHFPSNGLETIRLFSRSAKPAALSADDTETETESETYVARGFPFPRIPPPAPPRYAIDPSSSSPIPAPDPPPSANVYLESLSLESLALSGTLLVRNLAYEKTVAVRFTLDDWHITSEVSAKYLQSLPALPDALFPNVKSPSWDRFTFVIRLDDYARTLHKRTMWLVVRYVAPAVTEPSALGLLSGDTIAGEWWDNNAGNNYKVGFREETDSAVGTRRTVVSAPCEFRLFPPPSRCELFLICSVVPWHVYTLIYATTYPHT